MGETTCGNCQRTIGHGQPAFILGEGIVCRDCHDEAEPTCPNCHKRMNRKMPKTRGKCPECGEWFYIDREQSLFPSSLLNGHQADDLEMVRSLVAEATAEGIEPEVIERWWGQARLVPDPAAGMIELAREAMGRAFCSAVPGSFSVLGWEGAKAARIALNLIDFYFGPVCTKRQIVTVAISLANIKSQAPARIACAWFESIISNERGWENLADLYSNAARLCADWQLDPSPYTREEARAHARAAKANGYKRVEVSPGSGCPAASHLHNVPFEVDDFIANPPLPIRDCAYRSGPIEGRDRCRCLVVPHLDPLT